MFPYFAVAAAAAAAAALPANRTAKADMTSSSTPVWWWLGSNSYFFFCSKYNNSSSHPTLPGSHLPSGCAPPQWLLWLFNGGGKGEKKKGEGQTLCKEFFKYP